MLIGMWGAVVELDRTLACRAGGRDSRLKCSGQLKFDRPGFSRNS